MASLRCRLIRPAYRYRWRAEPRILWSVVSDGALYGHGQVSAFGLSHADEVALEALIEARDDISACWQINLEPGAYMQAQALMAAGLGADDADIPRDEGAPLSPSRCSTISNSLLRTRR